MSMKCSLFVLVWLFAQVCLAQKPIPKKQVDTLVIKTSKVKKETVKFFNKIDTSLPYSPRVATMRSAVLPGWGQITNKKYWKLPLVYGTLGATGYVFFSNLKNYREAKTAYILATDGDPTNDDQIIQPYFAVKDQPDVIRSFRNAVRQDVDYSVLFFIGFWGLQVADAAVDANLKTFDVSDDLSLQFKPGFSPMARTAGLSLVLHIGK